MLPIMGRGTKRLQREKSARLMVYLDPKTRTALRIRALQEGASTTKLVERLIRDYLARKSARRG